MAVGREGADPDGSVFTVISKELKIITDKITKLSEENEEYQFCFVVRYNPDKGKGISFTQECLRGDDRVFFKELLNYCKERLEEEEKKLN